MKYIQLTKDKVCIVDADIYSFIGNCKWCAKVTKHTAYAVRKAFKKTEYLHHYVAGYPLFKNEIDHIDGNGLNNLRSNLRIVTKRQNAQNRLCHRNGKIPGVYWDSTKKRWATKAFINGKNKRFGRYKTIEEASKSYQKAIT